MSFSSSGRLAWKGTTMHDWRQRVEMKGLTGCRAVEVGDGGTIGGEPSHGFAMAEGHRWEVGPYAPGAQVGSVRGTDPDAAGDVSGIECPTVVRGVSGGGLRWRRRRGSGSCSESAAIDADGDGGPVRDATGTPGTGGLRHVSDTLGSAARTGGGSGSFADDVAGVLRDTDDGDGDDGSGTVVRILRWRSGGVAVRSDEGGGDHGWTGDRRPVGVERGVRAVRVALGLPDPRVPAVPGPDQGQGGTQHPPRAHGFLPWSAIPERRGPERAGMGMASGHGERAAVCGMG